MPAFAYGPGLLSVAHGPKEFVKRRDLEDVAVVYALTAAIVSDREEDPTAVLIRALEPRGGIEAMKRTRGKDTETELCSGPAKLAQALAIDRSLDGTDLVTSDIVYVRRGRKLVGLDVRGDGRASVSNTRRDGRKSD